MKNTIVVIALTLLASCQNTRLEDDTRYVRLGTIIDVHEFTEIERKQAQANRTGDTRIGIGFGIGVGGGSSFSALSFGVGHQTGGRRDQPPHIADGAIRYTVEMLCCSEHIEVMSLERHNKGDCVKVLSNHPTEYPRFFELKPSERCK